ncbi:calcium-binding protein [Microvirga terricola]|uniref:Cadherin domain-containing protein n=1 Tax=Microvirga terricola TaxID=2719797 RepID=A0ABX0V839_9HYPH|nr:calcium-binding protein [Microvirga terricola]NIX76029.1 hypothetical protein [Microvirga terricola]
MANEAFGANQLSVNGIDWEEQEKALTTPIEGGASLADTSSVQSANPGQVYELTAGADALFGTGGDDTFRVNVYTDLSSQDELHGADGIDTLMVSVAADLSSLKAFDGIEVIQGDDRGTHITISAERLRDVLTISGGAGTDVLVLTGGVTSLVGKTILGIEQIIFDGSKMLLTVDSKDVALAVSGSNDSSSTLILTGGAAFTAAEVERLFKQGISVVKDSAGTYTNLVPELTGQIGGYVKAGEQIHFLSKTTLIDDDIRDIYVQIEGARDGIDHWSVDTSGRVQLVQQDGSTFVSVDGTIIGALQDFGPQNGMNLSANSNATMERVTEFLHALTYWTSNLEDPIGHQVNFRVAMMDQVGREMNTWGKVFIGEEQNSAPTDIILSDLTVLEHDLPGSGIGLFTTEDANAGDTFTYTLIDDAGGLFALDPLRNNKLVVGDGFRIDFERQREHDIVVQVDDGHGGVFQKTITISVRDAAPELTRGTEGDDLMLSDVGNDMLFGNGGNDTLIGGEGRDRLYGGVGHDVFVFDQPQTLSNRDTIHDFNTAEDMIYLAKGFYVTAGAIGALTEQAFVVGLEATTEDQRFIYDIEEGRLYYDADGSGEDFTMREIAFFAGDEKPVLTFSNFYIYDNVNSPFI